MPHIRDEEPLNICSEKVQDHGSTSWVRSLVKENFRTVKPPPELHTRTLHKPSCKNRTRIELGSGTAVLGMDTPQTLMQE
jgi:hypothetical protein